MTIGAAWNIDNPKKPYTDWDRNANKRIPIGLNDWLVNELGTTYGSHTIIAASPVQCTDDGTFQADDAGTILPRLKFVDATTPRVGTKYPFTVRVVGADGVTTDDRTFYLKAVEA